MLGSIGIGVLGLNELLYELKAELKNIFGKKKLRKIIVYGSYAREKSNKESDLDIMVLVDMDVDMEEELSVLFYGRKIDLRTSNDLSRYFRSEIIKNAEVLYVEG